MVIIHRHCPARALRSVRSIRSHRRYRTEGFRKYIKELLTNYPDQSDAELAAVLAGKKEPEIRV